MKLCYINTDSFIVYRKTENIYSDIAKDVKTGFDASIYELDRPLTKVKNKKLIEILKDENDDNGKSKGTKNVSYKDLKIIKIV